MAESMYQSWMLKYRPQEFEHILGQDHVTMVLKGMLSKGFISPSMIVTGPWGVGKTSIARITSKALLCAAPIEGMACNSCESCREFDAGTNINYLERDAASAGKVTDIRELIKLCAYPPIGSSKRVIVLDEAQRITPEGWNALLKTLEECVEHTIFIFCTTEPDKILDTIKSRSRIFPLKPITTPLLTRHLQLILINEGAVDPDLTVLNSIADVAQGHLRDAINLLEQLHICGPITHENFLKVTNKADSVKIKEGLKKVSEDPTHLLMILPEWLQAATPQDIALGFQDILTKHQLSQWKIDPDNSIPGLGDVFPLMDWMNSSPLPTSHLQLQNYVMQLVARLSGKSQATRATAQPSATLTRAEATAIKPPSTALRPAATVRTKAENPRKPILMPEGVPVPWDPQPTPVMPPNAAAILFAATPEELGRAAVIGAQIPNGIVPHSAPPLEGFPGPIMGPPTAQHTFSGGMDLSKFSVTKAIPGVGEYTEFPQAVPAVSQQNLSAPTYGTPVVVAPVAQTAAPVAAPAPALGPSDFLSKFAVSKPIPAVGEASEV